MYKYWTDYGVGESNWFFTTGSLRDTALRDILGMCGGVWENTRHSASLVAQLVKNPPAMRETWILSLGWEDPLEKGEVTHSSTLAWKIPWVEEPGRLQSMGSQRVGHD